MSPVSRVPLRVRFLTVALGLAVAGLPGAPQASAQEDEIVANLAGGRVIVHVTKDSILFATIEQPLESKSVPPRIASVDRSHIGVFFGASEWQIPAQPRPIRLDRDIQRTASPDAHYLPPPGLELDLEEIGIQFLEKLRPLTAQLHHKIDLQPDEPLFSLVMIGYGPKDYGAEVWVIDYRVEQQSVSATEDYWQTKILRPRFTQLYPPEKKGPHTLVEARFPENLPDPPLQGLLEQNDPRVARLASSDPRFGRVAELIHRGQAQKAVTSDATDFLRAALPILAGKAPFVLGVMSESGTFAWVVPPEEPREQPSPEQQARDKSQPPDAPTLRRKTDVP